MSSKLLFNKIVYCFFVNKTIYFYSEDNGEKAMTTFNFSKNVTQLRRNKKITQEELAEFIGVTKASVSKWETGATMPDIVILPQLASFFDVSVDNLLGYEPQLSREQIQLYYHRLAERFSKDKFDDVMSESRLLVRKYYSCYSFIEQMAVLWLNHAQLAGDEEKTRQVFDEVILLCNHIIEDSKNINLCNNAVNIKVLVNLQIGRADKVIEDLEEEEMDVNRLQDKGLMLTIAYRMTGCMEKAEKSAQIGMYRSMMDLIGFGLQLLSIYHDNEEYSLEIMKRFDSIVRNFELESLNPNTAANYHYQVAVNLCGFIKGEDNDLEELVYERLEKYVATVKQLFNDGIRIHGDYFFSTLDDWFAGLDLGNEPIRNGKLVLESAIAGLQSPILGCLKDQRRIQGYIQDLKKINLEEDDINA